MKKLWHSFVKELKLASRSFYFYIEIVMAAVMVFLLLFVIPENFTSIETEYIFLDMSEEAQEYFIEEYFNNNENILSNEPVEFELDNKIITAQLYKEKNKEYFLFDDEQVMINLAKEERKFAAVIHLNDTHELTYTYYLQGYETERLRNIYKVLHNGDIDILSDHAEGQEVRSLNDNFIGLTDRENMLPSFLTFNGSLMGFFIIASYIFLDKKEGVIKAYAVTPSSIAQYLLSKIGVIMLTSTITSFLIVVPVMGFNFNAFLLVILLLTSGFAASVVGIILASFYEDIMQSFAAIFGLIIVLMLPNIAYFIPSWNPAWIKLIPSYYMQEGFKEILLPNPDALFVFFSSFGFLIAGLVLFMYANWRFKKTLTV